MIPSNYSIKLIDIKNDDNIVKVLNEYPIYDEKYRNVLNEKILDHYAYEDIGFETPFLFAHYLKVKLQEIMPKYNMIYNSEIMKIDPVLNFSLKEQVNRENNGVATSSSDIKNNTTSSSEQTDNQKHVFQNTPQGNLSKETIEDYTYATTHDMESNKQNISGEKNSNSISTDITDTNSTENYIKNISGINNISSTKLYLEFVNNFNHIDTLIINELEDLFMGIW